MAPKRKRKGVTDENHEGVEPSKRKSTEDVSSKFFMQQSQSFPSQFSNRTCESWFQKYASKDTPGCQMIGPDGVEKFCQDLNVDPADIAMLVIAWKMEAENMGYFKLTEWKCGLKLLQCDSVTKLKQKLDSLRTQMKEPATFKNVYRYSYNFSRDKDQRSLDIETGKAMIQLLLKDVWPLAKHFIEYLNQSKYKVINRDQWNSLLEFIRIFTSDFTNYDEDGAWPVMLDEFVDWFRENSSKSNISSPMSTAFS